MPPSPPYRDHAARKFVVSFQSGVSNVQELAELPGERLCFSSNPALFIVSLPAKGGVSELLRAG
ncbi:hypothetical protein KCP70_13320 [Salmonella enterica subsp. enterica]|nr:hypothetical protein KCP70_13320 [Salmonella enterica subsp. enterica]